LKYIPCPKNPPPKSPRRNSRFRNCRTCRAIRKKYSPEIDLLALQRDPDIGDLADWQSNFDPGSLGATMAVPEPTGLLLAGLMTLAAGALPRGNIRQ